MSIIGAKTPFSLVVKNSFVNLKTTFKDLSSYRKIFHFLLARLVYNDALITIFAFGGIYASTSIGFSFEEIIILGIVLNVMAGIGAFVFGYLEDGKGSEKDFVEYCFSYDSLSNSLFSTRVAWLIPIYFWR